MGCSDSPNNTGKGTGPSLSHLNVRDVLVLALQHLSAAGQPHDTSIIARHRENSIAALAALANLAEGLQVGGMCVSEAPHVHVPERQLGRSLQRLRCPCSEQLSGDSTGGQLRQQSGQHQPSVCGCKKRSTQVTSGCVFHFPSCFCCLSWSCSIQPVQWWAVPLCTLCNLRYCSLLGWLACPCRLCSWLLALLSARRRCKSRRFRLDVL